MKLANAVLIVILIAVYAGCSTQGGTYLSSGHVSVTLGSNILQDPEKLEVFKDYQVVETLHRYVTHRFRKLKVRQALQVSITISSMRLKTSFFSGGRSHMAVDVIVQEHGRNIADFSSTITTKDNEADAVRGLSKGIAKQLYDQIQYL